jgi:hypothetical protein
MWGPRSKRGGHRSPWVPRNHGFWEGFVVVGLALLALRKTPQKVAEKGTSFAAFAVSTWDFRCHCWKKNIEMAKDRDAWLIWKVTKIFQNLGKRDQWESDSRSRGKGVYANLCVPALCRMKCLRSSGNPQTALLPPKPLIKSTNEINAAWPGHSKTASKIWAIAIATKTT